MKRPLAGWLCSTLVLILVLYGLRTWPLARDLANDAAIGEPRIENLSSDAPAGVDRAVWRQLAETDQSLTFWQISWNAAALLDLDPKRLVAQGQCFPMPSAGLIGEHQIEQGILSLPWRAVSGNPVFAYNMSVVTTLVVAAGGMFLFVYRWTASVPAAMSAAIAFALSPVRIPNALLHPMHEAFHWIPVVLWAFDRVLDDARARHSAILAFALVMAGLAGGYPLIATAALVPVYALVRLASESRLGRLDRRRLLLVALATIPAIAIVAPLLWSYHGVAEAWVVERSRRPSLARRADYLPRGPLFPGMAAAMGLALLGVRSATRAPSPRFALALAGLFVVALCSSGPWWPGGPEIGDLYSWIAERVSLLRSARVPRIAATGASVALLALGMIGWGAALSRSPSTWRRVLGALVVVAPITEFLSPAVARTSFGDVGAIEVRRLAPEPALVDAVRVHLAGRDDPRAVLDVPPGRMAHAGPALVLAVYHGLPTSACFQSLTPLSELATSDLAKRSSSGDGVAEIAAAGFGSIVVHRKEPSGFGAYAGPGPVPPAQLLFGDDSLEIWSVPAPGSRDHALDTLEIAGVSEGPPLFKGGRRRGLAIGFRNDSDTMWAVASPAKPIAADVEFRPREGAPFVTVARLVPPLAIAPHASRTAQAVIDESPPDGEYTVSIRLREGNLELAGAPIRWTGGAAAIAPEAPESP